MRGSSGGSSIASCVAFFPGRTSTRTTLRAGALTLLSGDERVSLGDETDVLERVALLYRRLAHRRDMIELFRNAEADFEVAFSLGEGTDVLRGTIDCLLRQSDGGLVVIEIKTGSKRLEHVRQLDAYVRAVGTLYPGRHATGVLMYP